MHEQPITKKRLTSQNERLAKKVMKKLLTLLQGQLGQLGNDLVQFASNKPGWWIVETKEGYCSFYVELPMRDLLESIPSVGKELLGIGRRFNGNIELRAYMTQRYHLGSYVVLGVKLCDPRGVGFGRRRELHLVFQGDWCIYQDHPLYKETKSLVARGANGIYARRWDRSFWFPGVYQR